MLNLVVNAKEAMPLGGTVSVTTQSAASGVSLSVRDQGSGIAPEQADHIFEPYFTTKHGRNTGLGLFAVATIARPDIGRGGDREYAGCGDYGEHQLAGLTCGPRR